MVVLEVIGFLLVMGLLNYLSGGSLEKESEIRNDERIRERERQAMRKNKWR
jgi:hypothetical protein